MNGDHKTEEKLERKKNDFVICRICKRKIESGPYSWEEDDEDGLYCRDCRAEIDSCGCSDQ